MKQILLTVSLFAILGAQACKTKPPAMTLDFVPPVEPLISCDTCPVGTERMMVDPADTPGNLWGTIAKPGKTDGKGRWIELLNVPRPPYSKERREGTLPIGTLIGSQDGTPATPTDISSNAVQIWSNKIREMDSTNFRKLMDSINYDINSRLDTLKREQRELDSLKQRVSSLSIKLPNEPRTAPKKKGAKP